MNATATSTWPDNHACVGPMATARLALASTEELQKARIYAAEADRLIAKSGTDAAEKVHLLLAAANTHAHIAQAIETAIVGEELGR